MDVRGKAAIKPVASIAIVGVALRFPGSPNPLAFHELTLSGQRLFQLTQPSAGPAAASGMAAQHQLAAETAAAALADARLELGLDRRWARIDKAGLIIADTPLPAARAADPAPQIGDWIRDRLGLTDGQPIAAEPTPDCSLRAIAGACETLASGAFDLMVAGGVSGLGMPSRSPDAPRGARAAGVRKGRLPKEGASAPPGLSRSSSSPAHVIRVYDANPTGTRPGEGCGMVVLMRACDARTAGLPVYAEIAGWSEESDGREQRAVIRAAYNRAGVDPEDVHLVEGHGAATADEDLAELTALLDVLGPRRGRGHGCALGAVSANIGDTQGAAGVAALLKTALAMADGKIPPTTGCVTPHDLLRCYRTPFHLPRDPHDWPNAAALLASVNSLGAIGADGVPAPGRRT